VQEGRGELQALRRTAKKLNKINGNSFTMRLGDMNTRAGDIPLYTRIVGDKVEITLNENGKELQKL
jgi:hypothetical protein